MKRWVFSSILIVTLSACGDASDPVREFVLGGDSRDSEGEEGVVVLPEPDPPSTEPPVVEPPEVDPPEVEPPEEMEPMNLMEGVEGIFFASQVCDDVECERPDGCPENCSFDIGRFVPLREYGPDASDARLGRAASHLSACMGDPMSGGAPLSEPSGVWSVFAPGEVASSAEGLFRRHLDETRQLSGELIVFATLRGSPVQTADGIFTVLAESIEPDVCRTAELAGSCLIPEEGDLCLFETNGDERTDRVADSERPPSFWVGEAEMRGDAYFDIRGFMVDDAGESTWTGGSIRVPSESVCVSPAVCPVWLPESEMGFLSVAFRESPGFFERALAPSWGAYSSDPGGDAAKGVMAFSLYAVDSISGTLHLWGAARDRQPGS